jgi:non-specific serine/threonine protein kinase/serine/threonine-protein kinase
MGSVYMAEQSAPLRRKVALKLIKPGMDSRQVLARFEAERQALALMDHPNIARVLDAGTTEAGQPYFVMELIKGVPITQFCDERRLAPRERLALCVSVCHALQHAHQKGILHRDLKPSNVLVPLYDDEPVPKVIDFGVAKAIREPLTERTLATGFGSIVGTFEYMSPEQAVMNQLDIDTRSDIYGIGVLLYELLTGTTPIPHEEIRRTADLDILRWIREVDPPTPSTRLATSDARAAIADRRGLDARHLGGLLRGELDWIVMKCLDKDRARRYETADGLARDLQRYLAGESVEACPPSAWYRLRKMARRNRTLLTTAACFLGLLLAGIVVTTRMAYRAIRAEAGAKEQAEIAQEINSFLQNDLLAGAGAGNGSDRDLTLRAVLDRAAARVDDGFKDRPLVRAGLHNTMGVAFLSLGEYAAAEPHFRDAAALYERERGPRHPETLTARSNLAVLFFRTGRLEEARVLHAEILRLRRAALGADDPDTFKSLNGLVNVLLAEGKYEEARGLVEEELPAARRALGSEADVTLTALGNLGRLDGNLGRFDEARAIDEEVLTITRRKFGESHVRTGVAMNNLATVDRYQKRYDEARALYESTLEIKRRTLGPEHPSTLVALYNLADLEVAAGRDAAARPLFEQALAAQRRVLGEDQSDTLRSKFGLASLLLRQGSVREGRLLCESVLASQRRALGPDHPDTLRTMNRLADLDLDEDRVVEARALYDKVLAGYRQALGPAHPSTLELTRNLAWLLVTFKDVRFHDPSLAESLAREALDRSPDDGGVWNTLGVVQYRQGRWGEALASLGRSMDLRHGGTGDDFFFAAMAGARLGRRAEARDYYMKGVDWMARNDPKSEELRRFRAEAEAQLRP